MLTISNEIFEDIDIASIFEEESYLTDLTFNNCSFSNVIFKGIDFSRSVFSKCKFERCWIISCDALFVKLLDCKINWLEIIKSNFYGCVIKETDIYKLVCHETKFECAFIMDIQNLRFSNFFSCDMRMMYLCANVKNSFFTACDMNTSVISQEIENCVFVSCSLISTSFLKSSLNFVSFVSCEMDEGKHDTIVYNNVSYTKCSMSLFSFIDVSFCKNGGGSFFNECHLSFSKFNLIENVEKIIFNSVSELSEIFYERSDGTFSGNLYIERENLETKFVETIKETAYDVMGLEEISIGEALLDDDIIVFVVENGDCFVWRKSLIKKSIEQKDIFYACNGRIIPNSNNDRQISVDDKPFLKIALTQFFYVPLSQAKTVLGVNSKFFFLEKRENITHSATYQVAFSKNPDYVGAFHCQNGSNIFTYDLKICEIN